MVLITIVTGANLNQLITGGGHIVGLILRGFFGAWFLYGLEITMLAR